MCGRFTQDLDDEVLVDLYGLEEDGAGIEAGRRWNGAPTQTFALCRLHPSGQRELALHRWGLVPPWARDPKIGSRMINARSETVDSKPSFRSAFRRRRCLVPANGWFEWQRTSRGKQPWWIAAEGGPFSFAGLWEYWNRGGDPLTTFTVLTCPASEEIRDIHHRQPAVVPRDMYRTWLDPTMNLGALLDLVRTPYEGPFERWRVSSAVNSVRNDQPGLNAPS